jgi:hypothetical protein
VNGFAEGKAEHEQDDGEGDQAEQPARSNPTAPWGTPVRSRRERTSRLSHGV